MIILHANGSNGVFSYGGNKNDGTTINISNTKITTKKDNSGGIMTTGGGNMNTTDLTIETYGTSSASIRSDRGGGNVKVSNATLISNKSEGNTSDIDFNEYKLYVNGKAIM